MSVCQYGTSSSAVAKRPRDASCLSVVARTYLQCSFLSALILYRRRRFINHLLTYFTLVKEARIEIGCVVTSLVAGWLVVGCHARAMWPNGAS